MAGFKLVPKDTNGALINAQDASQFQVLDNGLLLCLLLSLIVNIVFASYQVAVKAPGADDARPPHSFKDNGDGSYTVAFDAPVPGDYEVSVSHQGKPVQGSTFIIPVGSSNIPQQQRYKLSVLLPVLWSSLHTNSN